MTDHLDLRAMAEQALIEKAARAICDARGSDAEEWWDSWQWEAKAAIEVAQASWANERAETAERLEAQTAILRERTAALNRANDERADLGRKLNELTCHIDHYREVESVSKGAVFTNLVPVTHREAEMERQLAEASKYLDLWRGGHRIDFDACIFAHKLSERLRHASLPLAAKGK
jgi:hypothetical protein